MTTNQWVLLYWVILLGHIFLYQWTGFDLIIGLKGGELLKSCSINNRARTSSRPATLLYFPFIDSNPFADWALAIKNELDWPMMSAFTGFTDSCWSNAPNSFIDNTNVDSIYSKLVQRNRCNLNDYQNQANNGCKAKYMAELGFQNHLIGSP